MVLRFNDDSDGTGKLMARVRFRGFAGEGGAYFDVDELKRFAASIEAFPLPVNPRPTVAGGVWKKDATGELEQELFALAVYPIGLRGQIGVQVRLATELWDGDRNESQSAAVRLELLTTYEALRRFSRELRSLVQGRGEEATLDVEILS
jgi:hypothetical protein